MPTNTASLDKQPKAPGGAPSNGRNPKRVAKQAPKPPTIDLNTQLLEAVRQEKTRVVKRLLDTRANVDATNANGESALMLACERSSQEARSKLIPLILSYGCNVNQQDNGGRTALMRTIEAGDTGNTRALLDRKADAGLVDYQGDTALLYCSRRGNPELMAWLVKECRRAKLDVDHKNMRGMTALLLACQGGHLDAARVLVEEGRASLTIRDLDNFMTAKEWMKQSGFHSDEEMEFLCVHTNRRARRNRRAVKTLDEYIRENGHQSAEGPRPGNMYQFRVEADPLQARRGTFPMATLPGEHDAGLKVSKSMFDLPGLGSFNPKPKSFAMGKPVPLARQSFLGADPLSSSRRNKYDLYHSTYLSKRQSIVRPNRLSRFYAEGSLEPIPRSTKPQFKRMHSLEEDTRSEHSGKPFLPPLDDFKKL